MRQDCISVSEIRLGSRTLAYEKGRPVDNRNYIIPDIIAAAEMNGIHKCFIDCIIIN